MLQSKRTCPRTLTKKEVLLAIGGAPRLKSDPVSRDVLYLDTDVGEWALLTEMNEPRHHHAGKDVVCCRQSGKCRFLPLLFGDRKGAS